MKQAKRINFHDIVTYIFLIVLFLVVVFPVAYAFISSFKNTSEILAGTNFIPENWLWKNYTEAWKIAQFGIYTWNSVYYSFFCVLFALISSALSGYVFSRGKFPGKNIVFGMQTGMMFIVLGTSSLYPQLQILKWLHLNTNLWGIILMQFFCGSITNIFLVRGFCDSLPKEMDEAAKIDGCSFLGTFIKVILPLLKPVMATIGILSFQGAWNDYLLPMIVTLGNPSQRTLPVGLVALKGSSDAAAAWNLILAGAMISAIPMLIVYIFCNRYFIKGLTAGAVKG